MNNTEETLDFEQKHKEDLQRLRGFRLLDDDFMSKVFEDKACAEFLLQIILQRHDLKVQSVQGQYDIKNLQEHGYDSLDDFHVELNQASDQTSAPRKSLKDTEQQLKDVNEQIEKVKDL